MYIKKKMYLKDFVGLLCQGWVRLGERAALRVFGSSCVEPGDQGKYTVYHHVCVLYVHTYVYVCVCVCMYVCMCMCMCTYKHAH